MSYTKLLNLSVGSAVDIVFQDNTLVIKMHKAESLDHLLSMITSDNCHHEILDEDSSQGTEIW